MMKTNYSLKLSVFFCIILMSSCRKDISNTEAPENYVAGSFSQVFDAFWNGMNNNYLFWDVDPTNWNDMYTRYKPIFDGLDIHKTSDVKKSVQYFREMTGGLVDSHYNLSYISMIDSSIFPAYDRKMKAGILRTRYVFYGYDAAGYLDAGYVYGVDSVNLMGRSATAAVAGTIRKDVLYLGFNQFNLKASYEGADNGVKRALQFFINRLRNPSTPLKGVIIDVRGNGGGNVADLNFLVGNMIGSRLTFGYTRYKSGNGRLDYTPWAPAIVTPQAGATAVQVPIVVLTDIWSTSMSEITAMAIKQLSNGHTVGEKTWGATGPLADNENYNGGRFTASNVLSAYTSSSMFKYMDGNIYEGKGFPPDYNVPFDVNTFSNRRDPQLDKALSLMQY